MIDLKSLERDLSWAQHIADHGQTAEQRKRDRANVERIKAEIVKLRPPPSGLAAGGEA